MSIRILIADDHGVVRSGISALLRTEPEFEVVGEAADGCQALELAGSLRPDVVLLDFNMPGPNGIEVTQELKALIPNVRVLMLTVYEDDSLVRAALQAGVSGYVVKRANAADLTAAIHAVMSGGLYIQPSLLRGLVDRLSSTQPVGTNKAEVLTPREVEIMRLVAEGHSNRQIAERLCLSVRTVENHRANLMAKLGLKDRVELIRYAAAHKIYTPGEQAPGSEGISD